MSIENIVSGRALDWYSTVATRETINAIKSEEIIKKFNSRGKVQFILDIPEVTDRIEYLRHIIINLQESNSVSSAGSYEFESGASKEQRRESDIYLNIKIPPLYNQNFSFVSYLIHELKESFRHELEHTSQSTDDLMEVQQIVPTKNIWNSLSTVEDYYTSSAEMRSIIAGIYKKAKSYKKPATTVVQDALDNIYNTGVWYGYNSNKLSRLIKRVQTNWVNYLFDRYPRAK